MWSAVSKSLHEKLICADPDNGYLIMNKEIISFEYIRMNANELNAQNQQLILRVLKASANAFSPFSNYQVGAGVLLDNGEIITSTNQESEVYPSGICAERSLLYFVQANYCDNKIIAMAMTAPPCGACRQVMLDTERRNLQKIPVLIIDKGEIIYINCVKDLLPITFCL